MSMLRRALILLPIIGVLAAQSPLPVPRKASEFLITMPDGRTQSVLSLKGHVVVLCFIHTTCPHCQSLTRLMDQYYRQYSNQGFLPVAIAWNEGARELVPQFVKQFDLYMPVAYSDRAAVLGYLGISMMDQRLVVPQMVWIDRKGMVRAQTPAKGDLAMLNEQYYHKMISTLLAEPGPNASHATARR